MTIFFLPVVITGNGLNHWDYETGLPGKWKVYWEDGVQVGNKKRNTLNQLSQSGGLWCLGSSRILRHNDYYGVASLLHL